MHDSENAINHTHAGTHTHTTHPDGSQAALQNMGVLLLSTFWQCRFWHVMSQLDGFEPRCRSLHRVSLKKHTRTYTQIQYNRDTYLPGMHPRPQ